MVINLKHKIYIGADHAGFIEKEKLKKYLLKTKHVCLDISRKYKATDDYPDIAHDLAKKLKKEKDKKSVGILICGSGIGMCIAANKNKGIRAAQIYDKFSARYSKIDNNVNVACFRAREFRFGKMRKLADIWLDTMFSEERRHKRRIQKLE
jgi:ribose 5-phosphate isomerase B